jgi:HK97 family phage portal protein
VSVFFRAKPRPSGDTEQRGTFPVAQLHQLMGLFRQDFQQVDLSAAESSLQSVAVGSSVDLLASLASELPVDVFRGTGSRRQQLSMPGYLEDPDGDGQGLEDWVYRGIWSWLLRGNLYGNILQRGPGETLRQVDLFHPDRVHPVMENGQVKWLHEGLDVPASRMLHRRVFPVPGWLLGLSPIQYRMWTIGLSLTATRYGLQWFQDGAHPSSILRNTEVAFKDDVQPKAAKDAFMAALRGSREPVVLGKGWEWQQIQLNPEESQFLQTQGYTAAECCRIFGPGIAEVLGYGSGMEGSGSLTYSNIIDRDLHLLKYSLNKWLRRMERLLSAFLPRPQYVRFNRDALLETDTLRRYQAYAIALDKRFKVVNEVRDKEELPPVDWGDQPNPTPGATGFTPTTASDSAADEEDEEEGAEE